MLYVWGKGEVHEWFKWGNLRDRNHMEDPNNGRIILKSIFKKWDGGMDWIDLIQNMERWRALLNVVMNPAGSINCGEFLD
jgi:hypothetical protein